MRSWAVIFLLAACILAACSSGEQGSLPAPPDVSAPVAGDAIVEGTIGEASTLIPILASDSASHAVAGDLPLEQISERLGWPLGTVKSRLHYGLAALRERLERDEAEVLR